MIIKERWILGFTIFGMHWRGIKLYEDVISWTDKANSETNDIFTELAKKQKDFSELEQRAEKLTMRIA